MSITSDLFKNSNLFSMKHKKYFDTYDELFLPYKNKKIIFVEIGIENGGSLFIWKKFFHKESIIIGIDVNPNCKKFEKYGFNIEIGDQANPKFWKYFFNKYKKVDIILDDGGHTNEQQIITCAQCIPKINNGGLLVTEDTHASYLSEFSNPSKYSFINFSKKIIDDINFTYPKIGKFKFSINKYVYSIRFFESIVAFNVDKKKCTMNKLIINKGITSNIKDHRYSANKNFFKIFKKDSFYRDFKFLTYLERFLIITKIYLFNKYRDLRIKKYFK
jgi:hypothetical protein